MKLWFLSVCYLATNMLNLGHMVSWDPAFWQLTCSNLDIWPVGIPRDGGVPQRDGAGNHRRRQSHFKQQRRNNRFVAPNNTAPPVSTPKLLEAGEGLTEEELQRRHKKRANFVRHVKTTSEYDSMSWYRQAGIPTPTTPDPDDRHISKRRWELQAMHWRKSLRNYTRLAADRP